MSETPGDPHQKYAKNIEDQYLNDDVQQPGKTREMLCRTDMVGGGKHKTKNNL